MSRCAICNCEISADRLMCRADWRKVPTLFAWALRTAWSTVRHTRKLHRNGRASRIDVLNAIAEYGKVRRQAVDAVLANDTR